MVPAKPSAACVELAKGWRILATLRQFTSDEMVASTFYRWSMQDLFCDLFTIQLLVRVLRPSTGHVPARRIHPSEA